MIFIDEMKNMKIYRRQFFLPYNDKDKKHGSLIYLLTPNYLSSRNLMSSPITINRKYFESYYMERNVSYYIKSSASKKALEEFAAVINLEDKDTETEYLQDQFTAYHVSKYMDEEALRIAIEERHRDIHWYSSINEALKGDRKAPGKYAVYTHEVNNMTPVKIGEIEVELIEFTDYKANYRWTAREEIESVDEASISDKEIEDIITIKKSLSEKEKEALGMSSSTDYDTSGSKCFIEYEGNEPAAYCIVDDSGNGEADISVACSSKFRHKGYALKALKKGIAYARAHFKTVYYAAKADNTASQELAKKAGLSKVVRNDKQWTTFVLEAAPAITFPTEPISGDVSYYPIDNTIIKKYKDQMKGLSHVRTSPRDHGYIFIDNKTGKPIGFISVEDKSGEKWIQALEIAPDFQRHGYGQNLLQFAQSQGAKFLSVRKNNNAALNLYNKNGWKIKGGTDSMHFMIHEDVSVGDPVYFCKDITPENILKLYEIVGRELEGNVAVKLHSGEKGNQNFLGLDLYKLIIDHVNGTVVECNAAYPGARMNTEDHRKLMALHGWSENFDVDIMDSEGEIALPVDGEVLNTNLVGSHLKNYDSMLVLSHFKGHPMGGFGGALKNISIGVASSNGKKKIHRVPFNDIVSVDADFDQHEFIKAMSEAAGSVYKHFEGRMVFINVMKNISVDCDCVADAKPPCMADIGILASTNPVALDNACLSLIKSSKDPGAKHILERVEQRFGEEIITDSTWETKEFQIYDIDKPLEHRVGDAGTYSDHYIIKRWNIVADDGSNNSCIMVQGYEKPMRSRTSVLVFKNGKIFARKNDDGSISLPGGGWEPGENAQLAGEREVQEEINVNIKNMRFAGTLVEYDEEAQDWVKENVKNPNDWWYGYYTMIFVADYDSEYTGYVEPIDRDEIKNQGDWYDIEEIYGSLCPEYQHAADIYLGNLTEAHNFIPTKNLEINLDKWDKGTPLFIAGSSGDGKSTLANKMGKKRNAIVIHTDFLLFRLSRSKESWDNKMKQGWKDSHNPDGGIDEVSLEYISSHPNLPYLLGGINKATGKINWASIEDQAPYFEDFLSYVLDVAKTKYKNRYIIVEGGGVMYLDPEMASNLPLIIIGGSNMISTIHRAKRDTYEGRTTFAKALFEDLRKRLLYGNYKDLENQKWDFYDDVKNAYNINEASMPSKLYHGSKVKVDKLIPKDLSRNGGNYVFGADSRTFALAFAGNRWDDSIINHSEYNGQTYITELVKGAINKTYNTDGYIYEFPSTGFVQFGNHKHEYVNKDSVTPSKITHVDNILNELKKSGVEFYYYPNKPEFLTNIAEATIPSSKVIRRWAVYDHSHNDMYNPVCMIQGFDKPLRERACMIIVKDRKIFGMIEKNGKMGFAGGGIEQGESPREAAIREAKEEARIIVKNVKQYGNMVELIPTPHGWVQKFIDEKDWWYGEYSYIFIGEYAGKYTGKVADIDKDPLAKYGKWYTLEEAIPYLYPEYKNAIDKYFGIPIQEADGPQTPEVDIPMPEIPDPGKDLQNFTRTLKMRAKKGLYQMNAHARDLENQFPTADTILDSLKSGDHASSSNDEEETNEALFLPPESDNRFLMESVVICLDEDDSALDSKLKKTLYAERIRTSKDQLVLLKKVKADNKFIKYAYPDKFDRYGGKNVFYDLSYYIEVYFKNAKMFKMRKGVDLFNEFLGRLLDPKRVPATYTKKTVFIPVTDWTADGTKSWLFKNSINPISCIYDMIQRMDNGRAKKIFNNMDIIFFGNGCYFKLNFSELSEQEWKTLFTRFKTFVQKMLSNAPFTPDEEDETPDVESTKVIATNIADKLETNRGIKMSTHAAVITAKAATGKAINTSTAEKVRAEDKVIKATKDVQASAKERVEKTTSKATPEEAKEEKLKDTQMTDAKKDKVVDTIVDVAEKSKNTAAALDALDDLNDEEFKRAILDLELEDGEEVKVSKARAARMNELNKKFEQKEVNGVKVSDLINEEKRKEEVNAPLPTTTIPVDSPFQDQWSDLKYINYDKAYDVNKDVMKMLLALNEKKFPIAIRDLRIEDTSTSEDYIDTYSIEMEDFRGKRFTIKMDIPKFKDNKYLVLRGNKKTIQNQYFNMPILKTDVDTVQVISNYSKIFIKRFGNTTGKTISYCDRLLKALKKYNGTAIKLTMGDNSKLSSTFEAPIDYIDIGSVYSKIEYNGHTFYFNQDEFKKEFKDRKMNPGQFYYGVKKDGTLIDYVMTTNSTLSSEIASVLMSDKQFAELYENVNVAKKHVYSKASIMSSEIPLVIVASLNEGLTTVLRKANIEYQLKEKLTTEDRRSIDTDWIKFSDGYLVYKDNYSSSLLLNGLKEINPEQYSIDDIDSQRMWIETLDDFGGRIKSDGLQNFYECMIDPITYEVLQHYNLPTDYVTILIYANNLLADNKYISHGDSSSRRLRRNELISVKVYKTLFNEAYAQYANMCRHNPDRAEFIVKQNAVIDKFMSDPTSSDLSIINCLNDVESANAVSTKGESGMNSERSYTLDKRTYDDSMLNILGLSTGFANNVGVTRQTTLDANIDTERGYVKSINGDASQMSAAKSLTATEALNPMGSTHDDPQRTGMTFIQTAKHQVMTEKSDPLLVTNGADEVLPYMASDIFCKKAKADGKVVEFVPGSYFVVEYKDGSHDYINLKREIEKNSDGGFYVNTQLTTDLKEGSTVKKNQILAYEERSFSKGALGESNKLAYNVGKLIKIAVVNSDDNFEDSAMVTSKLAEDLATDIIMKEERILSKDTNIYNVIKPGTKVNQEDILFETQTAYDEEDVNILLKNLAGDKEQISKLGRRPVKSPTAGVIEGIRLYRTCEIEEMSESLQKLFKEYEREAKKTADVLKKYGIDDPTQYGSIKKLKPVGKLKNSPDSVLIEVYIKYHDIVAVGETVQFIAAYTAMCAFSRVNCR